MIPVEKYNDLYRDPNSKGIVNSNKKERELFLERKKRILNKEKTLEKIITDLNNRIEVLEKILLEKNN
jgi:hypothetical protein